MNNVTLIGRLTKDPELKFLQGTGTAVTNFTLAIDKELSKDKKQEMESQGKPTADFINIVVWGRMAETSAQYLKKGRRTAVQGRLQSRTYEDKNGVKRYVTEVVAERVEFIDWGDDNEQDDSIDGFKPINNDDIPF
ncbi:MAG TPA: single-stranded DNA-binding protein [Tissierellales bacterium]|nr:single-stranded DNA-binding protein [Tissierellales bacterium]